MFSAGPQQTGECVMSALTNDLKKLTEAAEKAFEENMGQNTGKNAGADAGFRQKLHLMPPDGSMIRTVCASSRACSMHFSSILHLTAKAE